jgi:hypothetical protein
MMVFSLDTIAFLFVPAVLANYSQHLILLTYIHLVREYKDIDH